MKKRTLSALIVAALIMTFINTVIYAAAPGVKTIEVTDIEETTAVVSGCVTSNSGIKIKEYGIKYGKDNTSPVKKRFYAGKDFNYPDPVNNDVIEITLTKLDPLTRYHAEFYAINENGEESIGKSIYFNTDGEITDPDITYPKNGRSYEVEDIKIQWESVDAANCYRLAMKSLDDGSYAADIYYSDNLTRNYYTVDADDIKPGHTYKIWVGACGSGQNDVLSQDEIEIDIEEEEIADTQAPTINIIEPSYNETFAEGDKIKIYAEFTDNVATGKSILYVDGYKKASSSINKLEFYISGLDSGSHDIVITSTDAAGNEARQQTKFIISAPVTAPPTNDGGFAEEDTDTNNGFSDTPQQGQDTTKPDGSWGNADTIEPEKDTVNPKIEYFSCIDGTDINISEMDFITFRCTATDNVNVSEIQLCYNGVVIKTAYGNSLESDVSTSALDIGANEFYVYAYDETGNESDVRAVTIYATDSSSYNEPKEEYYLGNKNLHETAYNSASSYGGIKVYVDGEKIWFDVEPEIRSGRTLVPLRAIFEALGAAVDWNGNTQTVYANKNGRSIELTIGSYYLYKNSSSVLLDCPAVIESGRTLVPVRAISEAFDCDVEWYGDKQLVSIVSE